ncbi:MAG TPA: CHAD domain-containing protein [Candidatus Kapabacteria bacterium]|nr:CHAD domain-containing protein [Candidatus Kapabacteria bacterium]
MTPLEAYYHARCEEYEEALRSVLHRISPEAIHSLRVAVKKIRALFDLINKPLSAFEFKKTFAPFKEAFKAAAAIRNLDITITLIKKLADKHDSNTTEILSLLKKKKRERIPELKHVTSIALSRGNIFSEEIAEIMRTSIAEQDILNFLEHVRLEIEDIAAKHPSVENMHTTRKLLKQYFYIAAMHGGSAEQTALGPLGAINTAQHLLGCWHDVVIAHGVLGELVASDALEKKIAAPVLDLLQDEEERRRTKARNALAEISFLNDNEVASN